MATKAMARSMCRYCHGPIGLSHWTGWIDLTLNGSYDMCPGTISAVHEPIESGSRHGGPNGGQSRWRGGPLH